MKKIKNALIEVVAWFLILSLIIAILKYIIYG
jgi:hypothetical protein